MKLFAPSSRIYTAVGSFVLLSLIVGLLCVSFVHTISAHADMEMSHATHKNSSVTLNACCDAGASDHMELWKGTLVGITNNLQSLFVLFAFSFVTVLAFSKLFSASRIGVNLLSLRYRQYTRDHPDIGLFNSLRLAFARGILNPKLF